MSSNNTAKFVNQKSFTGLKPPVKFELRQKNRRFLCRRRKEMTKGVTQFAAKKEFHQSVCACYSS